MYSLLLHLCLCIKSWNKRTGVFSSKKKKQTMAKTRRTYQLSDKFVFHQDWRPSTRFANWNQHKVTRMFQEHLHILGIVYLASVARIIHRVGGQSIRIAELWNPRRTTSTVTSDAPYEKLLGLLVLVNIQHNPP